MNAVSARKIAALLILAAGIGIGMWVSGMFGPSRASITLLGAAPFALPFVVLALIARFMASSWFSLVLVLIAASGAAWFSTLVYGDGHGGFVFFLVPMFFCMGAGVVAVLVLLAEGMVRSRARWVRARHEPDAAVAAKQASSARWMFAASATLFALVLGASATSIVREMLRHHEVNAAMNLRTEEERLRVLKKALTANDAEILGILAHQELPGDDLRRIYEADRQSRHDGSTALHSLASNPRTPPDLLTALASGSTALSVAFNPSAPAAVLERLAVHEDKSVRRRVAMNPSTSQDLLIKLAEDGDEMVRQAAAHRLNQAKNKGKTGKKKAGEKKQLQL